MTLLLYWKMLLGVNENFLKKDNNSIYIFSTTSAILYIGKV